MSASDDPRWWRTLTVLVALLATLTALVAAGGAKAQAPGADWALTSLREPAQELFTATGGALFARLGDDLQRSDDGGASWRAVALPPPPLPLPAPLTGHRRVAVDPTDPTIVYVSGAEGVYKTVTAAATWDLVFTTAEGERVRGLAASPADHALVYLDLANDRAFQSRLLRSRDAGATWDEAETVRGDPGTCFETVLVPHPADPSQVFRIARCGGGRVTHTPLERSPNQGSTWSTVFAPSAIHAERLAARPSNATAVGKGPAGPTYYLGAERDARGGGGARVYRGDADGTNWSEVLAVSGALGGLAYDPAAPARVYAVVDSGVQASANGGLTWAPLGRQDLGRVSDLALASDGRTLYAATDQGVWRLPLP
jgi:hypothetical protein